jgi:1-acyl-sn-glycerol-3-phosphate acyltransferase
MRLVWRKAARCTLLAIFFLYGTALSALLLVPLRLVLPERSSRPIRLRVASHWYRWAGRLLHLRIHIHGAPTTTRPVLLAANHVSWVDIVVLAGLIPGGFVAKDEIRSWPLMGWIATRALDTLFAPRGDVRAMSILRERMAWYLRSRTALVLFPEGTTTSERAPSRFHARLFQAVILARAPVQPVAIAYMDESGEPHELVPFVGDDSLVDHLWRLLGEDCIDVHVTFGPLLSSIAVTPRALAQSSLQHVRAALGASALPVGKKAGGSSS